MSPDSSSAIRSVLKIAGTFIATYGVMSADDVVTLINAAEMFFGAALTLWGAIWSVWSKRATSSEAKKIAVSVVEDKLSTSQAVGVVAKIEETQGKT